MASWAPIGVGKRPLSSFGACRTQNASASFRWWISTDRVLNSGSRRLVGSKHSERRPRDVADVNFGDLLPRLSFLLVRTTRVPFLLVSSQEIKRTSRGCRMSVRAGRLLREALDAAGFAESDIYLTNAVKHFHYEQRPERGKRRIHKTPNRSHIVACSPWLDAELKSIEPEVVVVLGSTAASAVLGPKFRLTPNRGKVIEHPSGRAWQVLPTVHPSSILRLRGKPEWESAFTSFVGDLDIAARLLR